MVVMTLIAVSSMENTILEERMASNFGQSMKTMQVAEQAAKQAEDWIEANIHKAMLVGSAAGYAYAEFAGDGSGCITNTTGISVGSDSTPGLYSAVTINTGTACPSIIPCQGQESTCSFDPTSQDDWDDIVTLPKGYITLGDVLVTHDINYVAHNSTMTPIDSNFVSQQPKVIIEYLGYYEIGAKDLSVVNYQNQSEQLKNYMFRITVIAWGKDANARYVVRSHYQTRWS